MYFLPFCLLFFQPGCHLCHQTQWAWGLSSQAFRPLSASLVPAFRIGTVPVLSRPLSRTQNIDTCPFTPRGVTFLLAQLWTIHCEESSWPRFHCPSLPLGASGFFWAQLLISEKREIMFFVVSPIPKSVLVILFFRGLAFTLCYPWFCPEFNSWFRSLFLSISVRAKVPCHIAVVCWSLWKLCW